MEWWSSTLAEFMGTIQPPSAKGENCDRRTPGIQVDLTEEPTKAKDSRRTERRGRPERRA